MPRKIWVAYKGKVPVFVYGNDQRNFGFKRSLDGLYDKKGLYLSTRKQDLATLNNHFITVIALNPLKMQRNDNDLGITLYPIHLVGIKNKIALAPFTK
jgi:hypothetical protein